MALTDKQQRFCEEYMVDLNATQAAIRAGYSEDTARSIGSENLTKPDIQNRISELKAELSKRTQITVDECIGILANIARADIAEFYNEDGSLKSIHDIPRETRDSIEELSVFEEFAGSGENRSLLGYTKKIKASGKQGAIDKLLKHLGGYEKDNSQRQAPLSSVTVRFKDFSDAGDNPE